MGDSSTLPNGIPPTASSNGSIIETPYLIVGAGPAGASLACFLASHDQTGILISAAPGTAKEPRAHITNPAAQECFRDIGLEPEVKRNGTVQDNMTATRWCLTMTGEEIARTQSWGNQPDRKGDYEAMSPCRHCDLPQTLLEPILIKQATDAGWKIRFQTAFVRFDRDSPDGLITSTVTDKLSGQTYRIRSKYLFGCDGSRSLVMQQLDIPLIKKPGQGVAFNVHAKADLTKYMKNRKGVLNWIFTPEEEYPLWGWSCVLRMVKPWHEWMFIVLPHPEFDDVKYNPTDEEYMKRMRQLVGDDSVKIELIGASKWYINEVVAKRFSDGNIFGLGDAVHRHPPFNGLGSNTCVQDAFNLAWKVAHVEKGLAHRSLLDSYSLERQPIGAGVVQRANQGMRDHGPIFDALGVLPHDIEERKRQFAELSAKTPAGRERRKRLRDAIAYTQHEFGGVGQEMNQRYESPAIYADDEANPRPPPPEDPVLEYQITTYPGGRLPHAWINTRSPQDPISTIDLVGHGAFGVITGPGGDAWKDAAKKAEKQLGVKVSAYSIGWNEDWEDMYGTWAAKCEIEEDGCVLCRPDRTVCWRSKEMRSDASDKLIQVLRSVLGRTK